MAEPPIAKSAHVRPPRMPIAISPRGNKIDGEHEQGIVLVFSMQDPSQVWQDPSQAVLAKANKKNGSQTFAVDAAAAGNRVCKM